ncbi:hypothetical protein GCM10027180_32660 [Microbulbifer echini]
MLNLERPSRLFYFIKVESGHLDELDSFIKLRIGLAGYDIHGMASINQCLTQIAEVNSLATTVRVAAITE